MTDYADLEKRLREGSGWYFEPHMPKHDGNDTLLDEAADAISALTKQVEEAREALAPFAERGRAEFTTGDYHNPDPAPESQIFGSELFLTVGDLRRATLVHAGLSSGNAAKDDGAANK